MSEYLEFSIVKGDHLKEYVPIFAFCRSSNYYQAFCNYTDYGKMKELDFEIIATIKHNTQIEIDAINERILDNENELCFLKNVGLTLDDLRNTYRDIQEAIKEEIKMRKGWEEVLHLLDFLFLIVHENMFLPKLDMAHVYFGIECGFDPCPEEDGE